MHLLVWLLGELVSERGQLVPLSRTALRDTADLAARITGDLFVLTLETDELELNQTPQDELVLWAYSGVEYVVEACGPGQPYVRSTAQELAEFAGSIEPVVLVALDVWHPDGARYPEPDVRDAAPLPELDAEPPDTSVVWIPTRPVRVGDRRVHVELHSANGKPQLLAYSSLDALRVNCGPHQAASAISADQISEVAAQAGAYGVVFDAVLAEESRRSAPVTDWTRNNHFG